MDSDSDDLESIGDEEGRGKRNQTNKVNLFFFFFFLCISFLMRHILSPKITLFTCYLFADCAHDLEDELEVAPLREDEDNPVEGHQPIPGPSSTTPAKRSRA